MLQQYDLLILYGFLGCTHLSFFGTCTFLSCFCGMWKLPLITHIGSYLFNLMWFGKCECRVSWQAFRLHGRWGKNVLPATYLKLRHCHSNCLSVLIQQTSISGEQFSCDSHDPFEVMQNAQEVWGTWNVKGHGAGLRRAVTITALPLHRGNEMQPRWWGHHRHHRTVFRGIRPRE